MIASVMAIYPGQTEIYPNDMGIENLVYAIIGNSTPVFPEVKINSTNITISIPGDSPPSNFTLVFIEKETNTIVNTIYTSSGGGGGSTRYVDRNVTVFEPKFYDRNVTTEKEVEIETIIYKDSEYSPWKLMLIAIFGLAAGWIIGDKFIYKKEKINEIEEEDYVSGDKKDL